LFGNKSFILSTIDKILVLSVKAA